MLAEKDFFFLPGREKRVFYLTGKINEDSTAG